MKKRKDKVWKRILAFSLACILVVPASVTSIFAGAWDASDSKKFSELRFWENEAPGIRSTLMRQPAMSWRPCRSQDMAQIPVIGQSWTC